MDRTELDFIPLKTFEKKYEWPTEAALRAYFYRRKENGMGEAFVKFGSRLLVSPSRFFKISLGDRYRKEDDHTNTKSPTVPPVLADPLAKTSEPLATQATQASGDLTDTLVTPAMVEGWRFSETPQTQ